MFVFLSRLSVQTFPLANLRASFPRTRLLASCTSHKNHTMSDTNDRYKRILEYWLGAGWESPTGPELTPDRFGLWFGGGPAGDDAIIENFKEDVDAVIIGEYDHWKSQGIYPTLAAVIVADQFCRMAFRGTPKMYAGDPTALSWSNDVINTGQDKQLPPISRLWFYLPLMHTEDLQSQNKCVELYEALVSEVQGADEGPGQEALLKFAMQSVQYAQAHRDTIAKWGRFPHRNEILGRQSTQEEMAGMADGTIASW